MDQSQRANAAQLAARNIKSVKSKSGRRQGANATGRPDQVPQFAPMPGNSASGLFGGSVQGASSFDFAPPAGGPSFPPSTFGSQSQSFGSPSPDVSDNEGRFEESNRATKRQFGGSSTIPPSNSFPPFGQSAGNPFASSNQPQASGGNIFSFGASQSQPASGINFNASAPANTPFSFGASSQSPLPSPTVNFGSGSIENKPASSPFNFGAQQNQGQGGASPFNFGQTSNTQDKPAGTPFQFGQTSTTTSGIFNSVPAIAAPSPSINFGSGPTATPGSTAFQFGVSAPAPAPSAPINFGSMASTQSPSNNLFGVAKPSETPQTANLFASPSQAPTTSLFSNLNAPAPTSNLFGKPNENNAPTNNIFGGLGAVGQPQPSGNMFSSISQPAAPSSLFAEKKVEKASSNLFGQSTPAPVSSNLFGDKSTEATPSNIFGNLNKATPSPLLNNQSNAPTSNLFGASNQEPKPTNDLFGNLNKPVDGSFTQPIVNGIEGTVGSSAKSNPFENILPPTPAVQLNPLFSAPTPSEPGSITPTNGTSKPAFSFSAPTPPASQSSPKSTPLKPVDAPQAASQPPPSGMFPSLTQATSSPQPTTDISGLPPNSFLPAIVQAGDAIASLITTRTVTDEELREKIPGNFNAEDIQKFFATFRITTLNKAMQSIWASIGIRDPTVAFNFYNEERAIILDHYSVVLKDLKRKSSDHEDSNPSKRSRQGDQAMSSEPSSKRKVTDEEDINKSPSKRNRQIESSSSPSNDLVQPSASPFVQKQPSLFNSFGANGDISKAPALPPPSNPSPVKSKRKATDELTQNTEQLSPLRREMKTPKLNGSSNSPRSGSETSNMFKSILESPSDSAPVKNSPQKKAASPEKPADEPPRFNPFGNLSIPKSPTKSSVPPPAASSTSFSPFPNTATANPFTVKPTSTVGDTSTAVPNAKTFTKPTFGGSTNFMAQFGAQAKKSEEDEEAKKLQAAKDADFDSEDDDEAEFEANWRKKRAEEKKELADIAKHGQGFKFGPVKPNAAGPSPTPAKAILEPAAKAVESTASKPLFGLSSSQGSGNSVFSSLNASRTPTPGLIGSSSGSVLDGHTPGKVAPFANNIFGHLSDVDSGKDDADEDDSPDGESGAEEDSNKHDPDYKPQAETGFGTPPEKTGAGIASTKKTNPFGLASTFGTSSGTGSPGGSLFGRAPKDSSKNGDVSPEDKESGGTRTPGGSLFDRITKDDNGNPVRHISTEEKENTQPSSRNIFGDMKNPFSSSINKTSAPADQTWKPDSPIKFGTASSSATSAPIIDITSATPTKSGSPSNFFSGFSTTPSAAPPSNLFGNKTDVKPLSSLFGTSSTSKAAPAPVGFSFGAPSAPASLFPSAVVSATTSRATTPGATTDGESGAEADPDAERHDQIDLTAGGPGEENENIVHEVRSKATKFVARKEDDSSSPWETRGVGPLRVLKHKDTQASRILMRADPSGTIVLNKSILGEVKYEATGKTLKLLTHGESGKGMETWILQVKTPEMAVELAKVLEANKAS